MSEWSGPPSNDNDWKNVRYGSSSLIEAALRVPVYGRYQFFVDNYASWLLRSGGFSVAVPWIIGDLILRCCDEVLLSDRTRERYFRYIESDTIEIAHEHLDVVDAIVDGSPLEAVLRSVHDRSFYATANLHRSLGYIGTQYLELTYPRTDTVEVMTKIMDLREQYPYMRRW